MQAAGFDDPATQVIKICNTLTSPRFCALLDCKTCSILVSDLFRAAISSPLSPIADSTSSSPSSASPTTLTSSSMLYTMSSANSVGGGSSLSFSSSSVASEELSSIIQTGSVFMVSDINASFQSPTAALVDKFGQVRSVTQEVESLAKSLHAINPNAYSAVIIPFEHGESCTSSCFLLLFDRLSRDIDRDRSSNCGNMISSSSGSRTSKQWDKNDAVAESLFNTSYLRALAQSGEFFVHKYRRRRRKQFQLTTSCNSIEH